jgi:hypothetical protein
MRDYLANYHRHNLAERKRLLRLLRKIQKAKALDKVEEILTLPSWRQRFRRTARLRVGL